MPSSIQNASVVIDGNNAFFAGSFSDQIREYSNLGDTVNLAVNFPSNLQTRMYGGNDIVTLSGIVANGFSNRVNGNVGADQLFSAAGSLTRDFIAGGSENDLIDTSPAFNGGDFVNGQKGDDTIIGSPSAILSVLRGGSENDNITVPIGGTHIVVGDLGTDTITLNGNGRIVLRTDSGNASLIPAVVDTITGFVGGPDILYIPGVANLGDLTFTQSGTDVLLGANAFTNGTPAGSFIAKFDGKTVAGLAAELTPANTIIGAAAEAARAIINPTNFLNDQTLGGLFA